MESVFRDPAVFSFSSSCSALPHTPTSTLRKQRTAHVYPDWSGNGLARSGFLGQTAPRRRGRAPRRSAWHRVSVKRQSRQGHPPATPPPRPAPPMCSCSSVCSSGPLLLQACAVAASPVPDMVELITLTSMAHMKGRSLGRPTPTNYSCSHEIKVEKKERKSRFPYLCVCNESHKRAEKTGTFFFLKTNLFASIAFVSIDPVDPQSCQRPRKAVKHAY